MKRCPHVGPAYNHLQHTQALARIRHFTFRFSESYVTCTLVCNKQEEVSTILTFEMGSYREHRFIRPDFSPLPPVNGESRTKESIDCLPDLIRYNASHNGDQTFCIQGEAAADNSRRISFQELDRAVSACSFWVENQLVQSEDAQIEPSQRPIALYLESDVGLFIHIAAMLASSVPVSGQVKLPFTLLIDLGGPSLRTTK